MSDSDSDDSILDALAIYKQQLEDLTKIFNELITKCTKYPNYVTKDKSDKIEAHTERFHNKCIKIKEFRKSFLHDPKKYGVEIEKRLMDIEEINKKLNDVLDSIQKRRREAEGSSTDDDDDGDDDLDTSSVTAYTFIDMSR